MYRELSCVAGALSSCRAGLGGFRLKRVVDVNIASLTMSAVSSTFRAYFSIHS
jgi:hypothetical protein